MKERLGKATALALALGLALTLGAGVSPASAVPAAPTVTALDASTPGHVTGTVASDQPFVLVRLVPYVPWTVLSLSGGQVTFDLETWGFGSSQTLQAVACSQSTFESAACSSAQTDGVQFTPTDVVPQITWPADTTIGPGQTATITVSDPDGGGSLRAEVKPSGVPPIITPLDRNGSTQLNLTEGVSSLSVRRCATARPDVCASFTPDQRVYIFVRTVARATLQGLETITGRSPVTRPTVVTDRVGTYSLDWHLEHDGVPVPGHGATVTGTLTKYGQTAPLTITAGDLPDDEYMLVAATTVTDPEFGTFPPAQASLPFVIDEDPPPVTSVTRSVGFIYPMAGNTVGHPGSTAITAHGQFDRSDQFVIRNSDAAGSPVRRIDPTFNDDLTEMYAIWDGTGDGEHAAIGGRYTVSVIDRSGNLAAATTAVTVSNLRLVRQTYRLSVPASANRVAQYVGRCSTLRRPARHGSASSLGYYANTRCGRQTWRASAVSTQHFIKLPVAERYVDVRVDTEGGAARRRPSSHAMFRFRTRSGTWVGKRTLPPEAGIHVGAPRSLTGLIRRDGSFVWGVAAGYRNRYDVRRYIVIVHYDVLECDLSPCNG